jgi:hypothetical protein
VWSEHQHHHQMCLKVRQPTTTSWPSNKEQVHKGREVQREGEAGQASWHHISREDLSHPSDSCAADLSSSTKQQACPFLHDSAVVLYSGVALSQATTDPHHVYWCQDLAQGLGETGNHPSSPVRTGTVVT